MSVPFVTITEFFSDSTGPLPGVLVTAELVGKALNASNIGVAVNDKTSARSDQDGVLALSVWPNTAGLADTYYIFNVYHPVTGNKIVDNVRARVPDYESSLSDILAGITNTVGRRVARAEKSNSRGEYDTALAAVSLMPDTWMRTTLLARLAVLNVRIWPYSQLKFDKAVAAVNLLTAGEVRSQLDTSLADISGFVDAYSAAAKAAITHNGDDKQTAQSRLNAAPGGTSFDSFRKAVQSHIDNITVIPAFAAQPIVSANEDLAELIEGAHPMRDVDGLAVRNPGQNRFAWASDVAIQPGSGWAFVEFDIDEQALEAVVGIGTDAGVTAWVSEGSMNADAIFIGNGIV